MMSTAPTPDPTYLREWEKFKEFVDQERLRGQLPQSNLYLHRDGVDLSFAEVVAHRDRIQSAGGSARRAVSSLQFFAKKSEHVNGETSFVVENEHVKRIVLRLKKSLSLQLTRPLLSRTIIFLQMF
jgi:hypothetical protein